MRITTSYNIGERVTTDPLSTSGVVLAIYYAGVVEYKVRYFDCGDAREIYFRADEISKYKETK